MTSAAGGKWADLAPRLATSAVLIAVGVVAIYLGGAWFAALVALSIGLIAWELSRMAQSPRAVPVGVLSGLCCLGMLWLPDGWGLPLVLVPVLASQPTLRRAHMAHAVFLSLATLAGYGLVDLRGAASPGWLVWLVLIVAATDIFGYFAGRLLGGPKFWPRISPKKTWSGTVAGWIGALVVGAVVWAQGAAGPEIMAVSVAVSMASQLGDIAQSALKRHVGVKDSSNLLPGHGGVFDRFDGVLGAAVFLLLVEQIIDFPPVPA
jgi:phosphatidate cytidylyltransferase